MRKGADAMAICSFSSTSATYFRIDRQFNGRAIFAGSYFPSYRIPVNIGPQLCQQFVIPKNRGSILYFAVWRCVD